MTIYRLAYRHGSGEVEGFAASGSDPAAARRRAMAAAREKAARTPTPFSEARLIESRRGLTRAELDLIRADWRLAVLSALA
jgi:hypothetical protein